MSGIGPLMHLLMHCQGYRTVGIQKKSFDIVHSGVTSGFADEFKFVFLIKIQFISSDVRSTALGHYNS